MKRVDGHNIYLQTLIIFAKDTSWIEDRSRAFSQALPRSAVTIRANAVSEFPAASVAKGDSVPHCKQMALRATCNDSYK